MTRIQVWVDIPDDCEVTNDAMLTSAAWDHAANEIPKHGWIVFSVRIREKWQWPSWLKASAIVSYGRTWYCCERVPILTKDGWAGCGMMRILDQMLFDFTPPPCDDWKQSLRLNPNMKAKQ